jgi:hypothetical protein
MRHDSALRASRDDKIYFHPQFDDNNSRRVFGYARNGGSAVGSSGQVIVLANMGAEKFPVYGIPGWPWGATALTAIGNPGAAAPVYNSGTNTLTLALDAFQVRVFTC